MRTNMLIGVFTLVLAIGTTAGADPVVTVTAEYDASTFDAVFETGDVLAVALYVSSSSDAPVFGIDLDVSAATDDVQILSATFNPAFARDLTRSPQPLPGPCLRAVRAQPRRNLDRSLGAVDAPVHFATLEVEVLNPEHFESKLVIKARGSLLGAVPGATRLAEAGAAASVDGQIEIPIANSRPMPVASGESDLMRDGFNAPAWTVFEAPLAFEVQPVGGGDPVSALAPETTYEVHYQAGETEINGYALFAVSADPDVGIVAADPPASGIWADTGLFGFYDMEVALGEASQAPGYAEEYCRRQLIADDVASTHTNLRDNSTGHLCNFTTSAAPGELTLTLRLFSADVEELESMEMIAETQVDVLGMASYV